MHTTCLGLRGVLYAETVIAITVAILVVLFSVQACPTERLADLARVTPTYAAALLLRLQLLQRFGTSLVGRAFAPILLAWLLSIAAIGCYNAILYHPSIWLAVWPGYGVTFFRRCAQRTPALDHEGRCRYMESLHCLHLVLCLFIFSWWDVW